jgi:hypothetical protein
VPVLVGGLVVIALVIGVLVAVGRRERAVATAGGWGPAARREVVDGTFADAPPGAAPPAELTPAEMPSAGVPSAEVPPPAPGDADGPSADRPTP